ncbi:MAG: DNA-directed RNA polymerase subunit epsilon [Halobacteriaceae archaeon]
MESSDPEDGPAGRRLKARPGEGALSRADHRRDEALRRWGVVTPAATVIGRPESPEADLSESVRRLHNEQHAATAGYSSRAHYLDRLRTTQALCNAVGVTPWERDRALGIMADIDLTAFGQQRGVATVALVVIRHVVDEERRRALGVDEVDPAEHSVEELEALHERYATADVTDEPAFERLAAAQDLDQTSLNRLRRVLRDQLEELDPEPLGRNPHRDPSLPSPRLVGGAPTPE